jgi:hypothetical protein
MPVQPDLFGSDAYVRHSDPQTSVDAARKVRFSNKEAMVLAVLKATGTWMTSLCIARYLEEAARTHGDHIGWSVSPRLAPLERKGAVERGNPMTVVNSSGNPASLTAWRAKR